MVIALQSRTLLILLTAVLTGLLPACKNRAASQAGEPPADETAAQAEVRNAAESASADPEDEVLVEVNGTPITRAHLAMWLQGGHGQVVTDQLKKEALDSLIEAELAYQKGLELGFDKSPKYRNAVRKLELQSFLVKRREMIRRIHQTEVAAQVNVDETAARAYYDQHREAITTEYNLASIKFRDLLAAEEAKKKLDGGAAFEAVARDKMPPVPEGHQEPAGGKAPWDLGYVAWNRMPQSWSDAVSALEPGQVSGIVDDPKLGIRIFKLIEKRPLANSDFEAMKSAIVARIGDEQVNTTRARYFSELKKGAKIVRLAEP